MLKFKVKITSDGTYCSTAVVTVAQQIQSNTRIERISVMVNIQPEFLECKKEGYSNLSLRHIYFLSTPMSETATHSQLARTRNKATE